MTINQKGLKVLAKLAAAGYTDEKKIVNMSLDDMFRLSGIKLEEIYIINELQKHIKANKLIAFFIITDDDKEAESDVGGGANDNTDGLETDDDTGGEYNE